jgi:hypothetical protein
MVVKINIFEYNKSDGQLDLTQMWTNYVMNIYEIADPQTINSHTVWDKIHNGLKAYNAVLDDNDNIVFQNEGDAVMFTLRWS